MLQGEKVILRPLAEADFAAWYAMHADVRLSLQAGDRWAPLTEATARERWLSLLHASPEVRVNFAIEHAGAFIGFISIKEINRQHQHALLAIRLIDEAHMGRGFGRDAVRTALRWAFQIHNLHRVELTTWATNERAIRSYRAVGFHEEGRLRDGIWHAGHFEDVVVMAVLRPEWLAIDDQSRERE